MMKKICLIISFLFLNTSVWAATANEALSTNDHNLYGSLGFTPGGLKLAFDYEYPFHRTYGLGGYLHIQPKDNAKGAEGATSLGAFIRPHFVRRSWDLYISPGFGLLMINGTKNETTLGPSLELGLMYQLTDSLAVGAESFKHVAWFSDTYQGSSVIDSYSVKVRFGF